MDNRLVRGLPKQEAAEWASWFAACPFLDRFTIVLHAEIEASFAAGDAADVYANPAALSVLAHKAGYREGLKAAAKLLTRRHLTSGS